MMSRHPEGFSCVLRSGNEKGFVGDPLPVDPDL